MTIRDVGVWEHRFEHLDSFVEKHIQLEKTFLGVGCTEVFAGFYQPTSPICSGTARGSKAYDICLYLPVHQEQARFMRMIFNAPISVAECTCQSGSMKPLMLLYRIRYFVNNGAREWEWRVIIEMIPKDTRLGY